MGDFVFLQNLPQSIHLAAGRDDEYNGLPPPYPNAQVVNQGFDPALIFGRRLGEDRVIGPLDDQGYQRNRMIR